VIKKEGQHDGVVDVGGGRWGARDGLGGRVGLRGVGVVCRIHHYWIGTKGVVARQVGNKVGRVARQSECKTASAPGGNG